MSKWQKEILTSDNIPRGIVRADKRSTIARRLNFNPLIASFNRKLPVALKLASKEVRSICGIHRDSRCSRLYNGFMRTATLIRCLLPPLRSALKSQDLIPAKTVPPRLREPIQWLYSFRTGLVITVICQPNDPVLMRETPRSYCFKMNIQDLRGWRNGCTIEFGNFHLLKNFRISNFYQDLIKKNIKFTVFVGRLKNYSCRKSNDSSP